MISPFYVSIWQSRERTCPVIDTSWCNGPVVVSEGEQLRCRVYVSSTSSVVWHKTTVETGNSLDGRSLNPVSYAELNRQGTFSATQTTTKMTIKELFHAADKSLFEHIRNSDNHLLYDVFYLIDRYIIITFVDELMTFNNSRVRVPTLTIRVFYSSDAIQRHALHCEPKKNTPKCFCHTFYKTRSILIEFETLKTYFLDWIFRNVM